MPGSDPLVHFVSSKHLVCQFLNSLLMQILLFHVLLEFTGRLPELIDFLGLLGSLLELLVRFWSCWLGLDWSLLELTDRFGG